MPIDKYVVKLVECLKFGMNFSAIKFFYTFLWRVRNVETWTIHYCKIPCLQARVVAACLKFIEIWEWFHETWLPCWLRRWLDLRKNMVQPHPKLAAIRCLFVVFAYFYRCLRHLFLFIHGSAVTPHVRPLEKPSSSWCWWTRWLGIKIFDPQNCLESMESYRYSTNFVSFLFVP